QMLGDSLEISRITRGAHVADEPDIPAEREPGDLPACSLAVCPANEFVAETDREGLRGNPEQSRDQIMAEFVEENERAQRADERDQDQPKGWMGKHCQEQFAFIIMARACSRVTRSISSTSPIERGASYFASASVRSASREISGKPISPSRKLATAISL